MNKIYWEVRRYNYREDEVDTMYEGKRDGAIRFFHKSIAENKDKEICYVLNKWVSKRYWDGRGWSFEESEIEEQYEEGGI